jgi:hypothetical protein
MSSNIRTHAPPRYSADFDVFWVAYPKKKSKRDAWKAWQQTVTYRPSLVEVVTKIGRLCSSLDWLRGGGQFIPYPATWLRADGWEDEPAIIQQQPDSGWHGLWSLDDESRHSNHDRWDEYTDAMCDWQGANQRPTFDTWKGE